MVFQAAGTASAKALRQEEAQQCSESRPVWPEQRERGGRWHEGRLQRWAGANQESPRGYGRASEFSCTLSHTLLTSGLFSVVLFFIIFQGTLTSKEGLHGTRCVTQIGAACHPHWLMMSGFLLLGCGVWLERPPLPAHAPHLQETEAQRADVTCSRSHNCSPPI